jgi:hypothetical protein
VSDHQTQIKLRNRFSLFSQRHKSLINPLIPTVYFPLAADDVVLQNVGFATGFATFLLRNRAKPLERLGLMLTFPVYPFNTSQRQLLGLKN